jgi:glycyl-tRNA synthetase beta chain
MSQLLSPSAARIPGEPRPGELLLELLSEEIPARMQRRAIEDLTRLLRDKLAAAELAAADIRGYVTPRRLVVIADGIPPTQPDRTEERRGPRVGAPQAAIDGFLRSAGLGSIEECEIRDTGRGEFYFAIIRRSGRPSAEVLAELVKAAITELPWSKSMCWPGASLRWVRPLTSIICLYDGAVVPLAIDGVPVGRTTRGHRFLSPAEFCADNAAEYVDKLQRAYVVVDQDQRRELIGTDLETQAEALGLKVRPDPGLLDEVTGLAEFPVVLAGAIDADFMTLPPEVLQTAMRTHQKYFSCADAAGAPAPHFLFVANNLAEDGGAAIIAGNERVLRARLADARFFWDQDRKVRLEDRVEALKARVYHARLRTMYEKTERIERLAAFLRESIRFPDHSFVTPAQAGVQGSHTSRSLGSRFHGNDDGELSRLAQRAAHLTKADLSTGMVGEFPELQGVVGRYYALHDGEDGRVGEAVADHYRPLGPNDACPTAPVSVLVALADKVDTLTAFFAIGEKPTGSRDPYALRRAAQGVIRLILENRLRIPLVEVFRQGYLPWVQEGVRRRMSGVGEAQPAVRFLALQMMSGSSQDPSKELLEFIADRLKFHLRDQGVRHDLIAAAFVPDGQIEDDLVRLLDRVKALQLLLHTEYGKDLLTAYRRASSIVAIEERKDSWKYTGDINRSLPREPAETPLVMTLDDVNAKIETLLNEEAFTPAMVLLGTLRDPVDAFFDKVTVNTNDAQLRENRLRLLARIRDTMNRVADFSQIEG